MTMLRHTAGRSTIKHDLQKIVQESYEKETSEKVSTKCTTAH